MEQAVSFFLGMIALTSSLVLSPQKFVSENVLGLTDSITQKTQLFTSEATSSQKLEQLRQLVPQKSPLQRTNKASLEQLKRDKAKLQTQNSCAAVNQLRTMQTKQLSDLESRLTKVLDSLSAKSQEQVASGKSIGHCAPLLIAADESLAKVKSTVQTLSAKTVTCDTSSNVTSLKQQVSADTRSVKQEMQAAQSALKSVISCLGVGTTKSPASSPSL